MEPFEDDEFVDEPVVAPAPPVSGRQWSWDPQTLLWVGAGVVALGFMVWFLVSWSSAKRVVVSGGESGDGATA